MFGESKTLRRWGLREALRFRIASSRCRDAVLVDSMWVAVIRLGSQLQGQSMAVDDRVTLEDWIDAHEKIMQFRLDDDTFEIRLELEGIDERLSKEYAIHESLRFGLVHVSRMGVVSALQLGYAIHTPYAIANIADAPDDVDWSEAPTDFKNQMLRCTLLRAVVCCHGRRYVACEVNRSSGLGKWPEDMIAQTGGVSLRIHPGFPNWCCEFAMHLQLQIPATIIAQTMFSNGPAHHGAPPPLSSALDLFIPPSIGGAPLEWRLAGDLWNTSAMAGYPKYFEDDDPQRSYYESLSRQFCAEVHGPPKVQFCTEAPELNVLFLPNALQPQSTCLRFDMPYNGDEFPRWERPDRVSIWALNHRGQTCFHFHGIQLMWVAGPDRLVDNILARSSGSCTQALAREGRLVFKIDLESNRISLLSLPMELEDIAASSARVQAQLPAILEAFQNRDQARLFALLQDINALNNEAGAQLLNELQGVVAGAHAGDEQEDEDEEEEEELEDESGAEEEEHERGGDGGG